MITPNPCGALYPRMCRRNSASCSHSSTELHPLHSRCRWAPPTRCPAPRSMGDASPIPPFTPPSTSAPPVATPPPPPEPVAASPPATQVRFHLHTPCCFPRCVVCVACKARLIPHTQPLESFGILTITSVHTPTTYPPTSHTLAPPHPCPPHPVPPTPVPPTPVPPTPMSQETIALIESLFEAVKARGGKVAEEPVHGEE